MRLLGVPCRPVSNFWSAHDGGYDRAIDKYFDASGKKDAARTEDSIWTFHVWNDVWMRRPDLGATPHKYDGWQAIDATPQEVTRSDRIDNAIDGALASLDEAQSRARCPRSSSTSAPSPFLPT